MVKNVLSAFTDILEEIDWLDDKTRIRAKASFTAAMTAHVGYNVELLDDKILIGRYQNVNTFTFLLSPLK